MNLFSARRRRAARSWWRAYRAWVLVLLAAIGLGATGLAGAGRQHPLRGERFDARHITITPSGRGSDGVDVREVIDIDFGRVSRHGYRLEIPGDLGTPTNVRASSPDANAEVHIEKFGDDLDVRIGSVAESFRGQHRYVVSYTYPEALRDTDSLALDVIGTDDPLDTGRLDVVVAGFRFDDTYCDVGASYSHGGCELARYDDGTYRTVIEPLDAGDGVTIAGDVYTLVDAPDVPLPPLPSRPPAFPRPMGAVLGGAALVPLGVLWLFARWFGINRVAQGGPTAAAFADREALLGEPSDGVPPADVPTERVADSRLDELATVEFAPPSGLRPWQGVLAVNEHIDERSVTAWFSDMIGAEALTVVNPGSSPVRLARGPRLGDVSEEEQRLIARLFPRGREHATLSGSDQHAVDAWFGVMQFQERFARQSGWWRRNPPTATGRDEPVRINPYWISIVAVHILIVGAIFLRGHLFTVLGALFRAPFVVVSPPLVAIVVTIFLAGWAALGPSRRRWPARSAAGSAAALRTLSFRKFLDRSEGQHVEWAWQRGVLREYSAWAVALGASDAWGHAIDSTDAGGGVELVGSLGAALDEWARIGRSFGDLDLGADARRYRRPLDNPWPRYLEGWGKAMASGGGGSSGGSRSSGSSSRGSRGVGGGGGGGRRSSW